MSSQETNRPRSTNSRWPYHLAWALACAALAQIVLGTAVTSYNAGTAVPDWPTTFGHWLYPPRLWPVAPRGLLFSVGHRVLGSLVILLSLAQAVALWTLDGRRWIRFLAVGTVAGVALQEAIAGWRVRSGEILVAKIHGCTAPLFLALCASLVTLTSVTWRQHALSREHATSPGLPRLALPVTLALYVQIVLCCQLRHVSPASGTGRFALSVWLVLVFSGLIALGLLWLLVHVLRHLRSEPLIVRRAVLLGGMFVLQLLLGAGAWVTHYGWPRWFTRHVWAVGYTVVAEGRLQVAISSAHAVLGSLTLAAATSLTVWSLRLLRQPPR